MGKFKLYRSQVLFIGLSLDEKYSIESAFNKYSVFYQESFEQVTKVDSFDLICLPNDEFLKNEKTIVELKIPILTIGNVALPRTRGHIARPISIRHCLDLLHKILPSVNRPEIESFEIGSVVRSKTTPAFGKGIVVSLVSEFEVLVRFPNSNLISSKDKAIRCHKAHLQILGNIKEIT